MVMQLFDTIHAMKGCSGQWGRRERVGGYVFTQRETETERTREA